MVKAPGALRPLIVVAVVAAGLGLATTPVAADPAPTLTVTPATGLLDRSIVTVTGTGFAPEPLLVAQCAGAVPAGCDLDAPVNTTVAPATVDGGAIEATLRVARVLELDGGEVSCVQVACSIVVVSQQHIPDWWSDPTPPFVPEERARVAIDFEATGTAPTPPDSTLTISVADMRAKGAVWSHWAGAGYLGWFRANDSVFADAPIGKIPAGTPSANVAICTSPSNGWAGCGRFLGPVVEAGRLVRRNQWVPVTRTGLLAHDRALPRMWDADGARIDCAVEDCSFALEQDEAPRSNLADVDWAPEWSPWPSAGAFVAAAYPALVGRPATSSERSAAIAGLTDRSLTGFTFLRQLAGRSDARRLAELTRLYQAALDRRPDATGLVYWESELRRTGSMSSIAVAFGRTPEFQLAFGPSANDIQVVHLAYERTLGRPPSAGERSYWVGRLQAGLARTHMIHLFSRTPEFVAREGGRSEVTAVTVALLRRGPTRAEWDSVGPEGEHNDPRTVSQRADDGVLVVLSSNQLHTELG